MPAQPNAAVTDTFVLERTYPRPVERVWKLLANADAKRRWFFEDDGTTIDAFEMDFRVGGKESARYSFRKGTPVDDLPFVNESIYFDIVPDERIVMAQTMSISGRIISAALVTFEVAQSAGGTSLKLIHQGVFFEGSGGPEMRKHGWKVLLDKLDAALASLAMAAYLEPKDARVHQYLGVVVGSKGWYSAAEDEMRKAIELEPDYAEAHYNLAVFYLERNPPAVELARRHYYKSVDLGGAPDPELEKKVEAK